MEEKVESVKIITEQPMHNGNITLNLFWSDHSKHWKSPELPIHPNEQDSFRYHYVVKYKEGFGTWLKNTLLLRGKDEKTVEEKKTRKLMNGRHQYDIFHDPYKDYEIRVKSIFLGHMFFVKMLYDMVESSCNLKEMLIECEHVGFGHPSYTKENVKSFIHWVSQSISNSLNYSQSVYLCSLLGQFVHNVRVWSACQTCDLLGQKAADFLLSSLEYCYHKALPKSSLKFIKVVAQDLYKAGSSTGCLLFIKVFCTLLDADFVMQVADKLSSQWHTEQQFHQQFPRVLDSLARLKDLESCKRFCSYVIYRSPSDQCLWNLYRAISSRLPDLVQSLVDDFSSVYLKFISRRRATKPDLLQSSFWSQVPENLKERLSNAFCKELVQQISSETNLSQERLDSLRTVALDARLQSADTFCHFLFTVATHKSQEVLSIIPVLLESKAFFTFWSTSISDEDRKKICFNWLRQFVRSGKKQKEQIFDVVEACESLCATYALKTNIALCQSIDTEVEVMVLKAKLESIMDAYADSQNHSPAIQQRLLMLLKSAINQQQSGTGDRRSKYKKMIRLLGYDVSKGKKEHFQKVKMDRYVCVNRSIIHAIVLGPVYMGLGTQDNPSYQGIFIEGLYEKQGPLLVESKLTLLDCS